MGGDQRPISSSRAFWELKAEQVMDRVFSAALPGSALAPIDVVVSAAPSGTARPQNPRPGLILMALLSLLGAGSTLLVWRGWTQASTALQQERTLRLLEQLRALGPLEAAEPESTAASTAETSSSGAVSSLPPPPLPPAEDAWVPQLEPLRLPVGTPVGDPINRWAPPEPARAAADAATGVVGDAPELVGVVQVPGQSGSAIFQMGGSSTSAAVGETIGATGWRLHSANGNSVVIERNGQQQRVSISGGF
ncbi:hypothetical protein KQ304_11475 [Synechococcus sp. CS-1329]|uniref:hypothetical protein n=1 Tax=Synechococcus sp. CS-1329 TaxID=2847975 RepID=UPI00223C2714|nr:hypothetical protein [Synechococcus sp. CS-1329]MCT0219606.1 hypothetical protein [Synechococcus sp. CS-1329]